MFGMLERLTETIAAVCPIHGVSGSTNTRIDYRDEATAEQRTAAQAALAAFDWSQAAHDAWTLAKQRSNASAKLDSDGSEAMLAIRALVLTSIAENNALRAWITDFKSEVAASTSLADLKTRVAALAALPQRTKQQVRAVISTAINEGSADT